MGLLGITLVALSCKIKASGMGQTADTDLENPIWIDATLASVSSVVVLGASGVGAGFLRGVRLMATLIALSLPASDSTAIDNGRIPCTT